jgi:hypothetical protein
MVFAIVVKSVTLFTNENDTRTSLPKNALILTSGGKLLPNTILHPKKLPDSKHPAKFANRPKTYVSIMIIRDQTNIAGAFFAVNAI